MHTYARVDTEVVVEIIQPMTDEDGNEIPMTERFTRAFVETLVDVTTASPVPAENWLATESNGTWTFSPPTLQS